MALVVLMRKKECCVVVQSNGRSVQKQLVERFVLLPLLSLGQGFRLSRLVLPGLHP